MIDCRFLLGKDGASLVGFQVSGHADFGDVGKDVVCAAVSSAAYLVANTITDVLHAEASAVDEEGYLCVQVAERDAHLCRTILEGLKLHLLGLEEQYPQAIHVSYEEV